LLGKGKAQREGRPLTPRVAQQGTHWFEKKQGGVERRVRKKRTTGLGGEWAALEKKPRKKKKLKGIRQEKKGCFFEQERKLKEKTLVTGLRERDPRSPKKVRSPSKKKKGGNGGAPHTRFLWEGPQRENHV